MSYQGLPCKDGVIGYFDSEYYDGSDFWLPSYGNLKAKVVNGQIGKDHCVYLESLSKGKASNIEITNIPRNYSMLIYAVMSIDADRTTVALDTGPKAGITIRARASGNTGIYLGQDVTHLGSIAKASVNIEKEKYYLFVLDYSPKNSQFYLNDTELYNISRNFLHITWNLFVDTISSISFNKNIISTNDYESVYSGYAKMKIKDVVISTDHHNNFAKMENIKYLAKKNNIELDQNNQKLIPDIKRLDSIAQAYLIEKNKINHKLFQKTCNAYRTGLRAK